MAASRIFSLLTLLGTFCVCSGVDAGPLASPLGIGQAAAAQQLRAEDLTIFPDGTGLPVGRGTAKQGAHLFSQQCAACHGDHGEGRADYPALAGGRGSLAGNQPVTTVGSYWPYATTVWDYIRRAMPYPNPGSLHDDEVYALTAYVLFLNGIVQESDILDRVTLPRVRMPNRDGFVDGWSGEPLKRMPESPGKVGAKHRALVKGRRAAGGDLSGALWMTQPKNDNLVS